MKGERLYEEIDATHHTGKLDVGPVMPHDQLRLGRATSDEGATLRLYYFGPTGCEWYELDLEAAELLRDQLTETLGPKGAPKTGTLSMGPYTVTYPNSGGTSQLPLSACICGNPFWSTVPPICPVHGRTYPNIQTFCGIPFGTQESE